MVRSVGTYGNSQYGSREVGIGLVHRKEGEERESEDG